MQRRAVKSMSHSSSDKQLILIFSKSPELGKVKTRLVPALGEQGALELYKRMLAAVLELCQRIPYETELWVQGDVHNEFILEVQQGFPLNPQFKVRKQQGSDLGLSLSHAFGEAFKSHQQVVVIGGDCISLDKDYLNKAFQVLSKHDLVIGPAEDGGYVLLGLRSSETVLAIYPRLFQGIEWGRSGVCEQTLIIADDLSLSYVILETRWDIDNKEDLERISADPRFTKLLAK